MPPKPTSRASARFRRYRTYRPLLEVLESRLPPGDLLWGAMQDPLFDWELPLVNDECRRTKDEGMANDESQMAMPPEAAPIEFAVRPSSFDSPSSFIIGRSSLPLFEAINSGGGGAGTDSLVDLWVANTEVTQAIQRMDNSVGLVAGKSTLARVYVGVGGSAVPDVSAGLYVFQDGVQVAGSPFWPVNGPILARPTPSREQENDTVNFLLPPLRGIVHLVPVVFSYTQEEAYWNNNYSVVSSLWFECRRTPSIAYLPTDYRPGGGSTPNLPDPAMIAPGVADGFVRAIYPVPSVNYYQVPGAPLLWTQDINTSVAQYFNALSLRRQMTTPTPDFLYGWLPGNPYAGNGSAVIGGRVAFGNTDWPRFTRTFAHELGHNFGLQHNGRRLGPDVGVDVENAIGLGTIKPAWSYDVMVAGRLTHEAFVDVASYTHFYNHPILRCGSSPGGSGGPMGGDYLFVTGVIDEAGNASLNPTYRLSGPAEYTESDPGGKYKLQIVTGDGAVREVGFTAGTHSGQGHQPGCSCPACAGAFALVIPNDPTITGLRVVRDGQVQDELARSPHAPVGRFVNPPSLLQGEVTLAWSAADADGDPLSYSVQYSPDGGPTMVAVAGDVKGAQVTINAADLPASPRGMLRLLITDGMNVTTVDQVVAVAATA
jgi:hypothetical protein